MTNHKTVSLRESIWDVFKGYQQEMITEKNIDQIISAVLERIPEKSDVMPKEKNESGLTSPAEMDFYDGYNLAIDQTIKNITGGKDE